MAVQIRVLKGGKPVSGVKVYYSKSSNGLWGEKFTDDQGYVNFQIDSGEASVLKINGKGISYSTNGYYLKNGLNEFRFGILLKPILPKTDTIYVCFYFGINLTLWIHGCVITLPNSSSTARIA